MLNAIIRFSLRNKFLVGIGTLCLVVFGVYEATKLPIDAQPDITNNQVQVITVAPSFSAADIERWVTVPIEQANSNLPGLTEIRSFNRFGLSLVTLVFTDQTDLYWARTQVAERLKQIEELIPEGIGRPELGPISTGLGEIFQYVVRPEKGYEAKFGPTELRTIQDWVIRRQLMGTEGVAEVSSFGGKLKQYEIAVNPARLQAFGISVNHIFSSLEKNNQNTGGAYIEKAETVLFIRSEGMIEKKEDLENLPVSYTAEGSPILLRDVAEVRIGHAIRYGAMTYNDQGEVSGAIVMMLKGENANKVIKNIKARLAEIEKDLPEGVVIEPFLDRAKLVNNTISTIEKNLAEGALIVVFILVLFLGNYRAGLLVASVIPLSMLFAIILMNLFGVGGNLMSLGALDFGLIVDGAVIIVEAVLHQMTKNKGCNSDDQVYNSSTKMVNSAVFGQIIILVVYLPIFTLQGIEGKMFIPMAQTVAFALIGAFILSLTYIPMMSALILKKPQTSGFSDRMMVVLENWHQRGLKRALKSSGIILTVVLLLFGGAIIVLFRLGGEFVPALEEGDFAVEMRILPGSNISTTIAETDKAAKILLNNFPEVEKVVTKIGSAEVPTEPMPMDAGDMIVVLKPKKEWTSASSFPELSEKMSSSLEVLPGLSTGFQFPVQMRFNELMTGARQDVVCKIFGEDLERLAAYADQLAKEIKQVDGAQDIYVEPLIGAPQLVITYNRHALARYKLSIEEVNRLVNTSFAGQSAGVFYEGERRFDIVVRLESEQKREIEDLKHLLIPTPAGIQVPLQELADVAYQSSPNQIQRENTRRRIVVGFNVRGRDVQSIVQELQKRVDARLNLDAGYRITYGGTFENLNQAKARLGFAVPISLLLILFLLYLSFRSMKYSLLIYTAIPLSAIGGIYFLALRGMPFSISAGIGFIALFGVAVLNGIVLVAEYRKSNRPESPEETVLEGTKVRLRPVLMTALVASLGFLPMALSKGAGAEVQRPLATVVIGGLLFATFLTLFVLPILYVKLEKFTKVLLLVGLAALPVHGQSSREDILKLAAEKSPALEKRQKEISYRDQLLGTAPQYAPTTVLSEYGKYNGLRNDTKWSVGQSFRLPQVAQARKAVLRAEYQKAESLAIQTSAQVQRDVSLWYQEVLLGEAELALLQKTDSLYQTLDTYMQQRLQAGEAETAETAGSKLLRLEVNKALRTTEREIYTARKEIEWHIRGPLGTIMGPLKLEPDIFGLDTSHPELTALQQEIALQDAQIAVEKSSLLPEFTVQYANQTMKDLGTGNYSSVQAGIEIPLIRHSQKKKIEAAKISKEMATLDWEIAASQLSKWLVQENQNYQSLRDQVEKMETLYLPQAQAMENTLLLRLKAGEIPLSDLILLSKQVLETRRSYFELLRKQNAALIHLKYLSSKS
jgi:cobalt-zinc-cadmium resistance protein CzcA